MTALTAQPLETADGAPLKSVVEYLPFVRKVAHRVARRLPAHITLDDLVGAGVVGLIEAMGRYDPTKVSDFEKYGVNEMGTVTNLSEIGSPNSIQSKGLY